MFFLSFVCHSYKTSLKVVVNRQSLRLGTYLLCVLQTLRFLQVICQFVAYVRFVCTYYSVPPVHVVSSKENRIFSPRMSTIYTYTRANSRLHINAYYSSIIGSFVAKPQHTYTRVQWFFSDLQNGIFYRLPESLQRLSVNDAHPWSQNYTRRQRENVRAFP